MSGGLPWGPPGGGVSSFKLETEANPYEDEARRKIALILQRNIFEAQSQEFASIVSSLEKDTLEEGAGLSKGNILNRRSLKTEDPSQKRLMDDTEVTMVSILDSSGRITLNARMSDLIVLMTRIITMEHKTLCMHILQNCVSSECAEHFVKEGGLMMLKRWLLATENPDELCTILHLCYELPFDKDSVMECKIGKDIKKVKTQLAPGNEKLLTACEKIMDKWKKLNNEAIAKTATAPIVDTNSVGGSKSAPSASSASVEVMVSTLGQRLLEERGMPRAPEFEPMVVAAADEPPKPVARKDTISKQSEKKAPPRTALQAQIAAKTAANSALKPVAVDTKAPAPTSAPATALAPVPTPTPFAPAALAPPKYTGPPPPSSSSIEAAAEAAPAPSVVRPKMPKVNMAEQAKKFNEAQLAKPEAPVGPQVGRSILKRRADGSEASTAKRAKMDVRFADNHGQMLTQIEYFEVEGGFKRTVVGDREKRTLKEASRKERQMERDSRASSQRVMTEKTCEWAKPAKLILSTEVTENSHLPVESPENTVQIIRVSEKVSATTLDSLILDNPYEEDEVAGGMAIDMPAAFNIVWKVDDMASAAAAAGAAMQVRGHFLMHSNFLCLHLTKPHSAVLPSRFPWPFTAHCRRACTIWSPSCCRCWCRTRLKCFRC